MLCYSWDGHRSWSNSGNEIGILDFSEIILSSHEKNFGCVSVVAVFSSINASARSNVFATVPEDVDLTKTIGLVIHADDADSHRRRSFCVMTMSSVTVGQMSPWDARMLVYVTDNQHCVDETWDTLDTWVSWSLTELAEGKWFANDPWGRPLKCREGKAGQPIAENYRGVLVLHKGDAKYMQRAYHTHNSWVSERVCWLCHATKSGSMAYTLHGPHAPHRSTMVSCL